MNLSDTFYIALCMTVLILGVVYWFWTQNQYIQRKLNLLENIVYEMKTVLPSSGSEPRGSSSSVSHEGQDSVVPSHYPPAPSSVLGEEDEDLLHEELLADDAVVTGADADAGAGAGAVTAVTGMASSESAAEDDGLHFLESEEDGIVEAETVPDDLQPGGVGSGVPAPVAAAAEAKGTVLDGMTMKELKRLAEQRGISGTSAMRKQQLVDALRALPAASSLATVAPLEGVVDLS